MDIDREIHRIYYDEQRGIWYGIKKEEIKNGWLYTFAHSAAVLEKREVKFNG